MKPKEGTILTVARVIAEEAVRQAERAPEDYDALFANILSTGDTILKKTQQMLPALTQAGVVDAGGRGLLLIYMGYAACLRGEEVPPKSWSCPETGPPPLKMTTTRSAKSSLPIARSS